MLKLKYAKKKKTKTKIRGNIEGNSFFRILKYYSNIFIFTTNFTVYICVLVYCIVPYIYTIGYQNIAINTLLLYGTI